MDYNKFMRENSQNLAAFRLLARVNLSEMAFVNRERSSIQHQKVVTCIRNIKRSIQPRYYLRKLLKVVKIVQDQTTLGLYECCWIIAIQTDFHLVTVNSLKKTMEWDCAQAAEKGAPLTWTTRVGDIPGAGGSLSHKKSVEMHLKLMQETNQKGILHGWTWEVISVIWDLIVSPSSVKEAKESMLEWLTTNFVSLNKEARVKLSETLSSCTGALKGVPGYDRFYKTCLEHANYDSDSSDSDSDE